jgi:hypothetical protein
LGFLIVEGKISGRPRARIIGMIQLRR